MMYENLIKQIEQNSNLRISDFEVITERRTSRLIKFFDVNGSTYACKMALGPDSGGPYNPDDSLRNEIIAYEKVGSILPQTVISHKDTKENVWILMNWIDGTSSWEYFRGLVDKESNLESVGVSIKEIGLLLSSINEKGLLHGDLQPSHIIKLPTGGFTVIDFGISQFSKCVIPYFGALVHYNSPEVAKEMITGKKIDYKMSDEVYSFAALCYTLLSGATPIKYSKPFQESLLEEMLNDIVKGEYSQPPENIYTELSNSFLSIMKLDYLERPKSISECLQFVGLM
ncbi:MAG: serine/threonine protein kinase [Planctomycetota bacterium]|jgi:serine/threonine protein kinase